MLLVLNYYGLLVYGLPALTLAGIGIWILKRETGDAVRAAGYLLTALGIAIVVGALIRLIMFGV